MYDFLFFPKFRLLIVFFAWRGEVNDSCNILKYLLGTLHCCYMLLVPYNEPIYSSIYSKRCFKLKITIGFFFFTY